MFGMFKIEYFWNFQIANLNNFPSWKFLGNIWYFSNLNFFEIFQIENFWIFPNWKFLRCLKLEIFLIFQIGNFWPSKLKFFWCFQIENSWNYQNCILFSICQIKIFWNFPNRKCLHLSKLKSFDFAKLEIREIFQNGTFSTVSKIILGIRKTWCSWYLRYRFVYGNMYIRQPWFLWCDFYYAIFKLNRFIRSFPSSIILQCDWRCILINVRVLFRRCWFVLMKVINRWFAIQRACCFLQFDRFKVIVFCPMSYYSGA